VQKVPLTTLTKCYINTQSSSQYS